MSNCTTSDCQEIECQTGEYPEITLQESMLWEIGYYMSKSNIFKFCYWLNYPGGNEPEINYQSMRYAHFYWRHYRNISEN